MVRLQVNGQPRESAADGRTPLLVVLRNDFGLTGTKLGCELEQCGACTVLVDGEPRMACRLPLAEIAGRHVVTVEGLGSATAPHPLQRALMAENAAQCGYCIAGIVVRGAALLERRPDPSEAEIRASLREHLCRCGAHNRIVRAVQRAARELARGAVEKAP